MLEHLPSIARFQSGRPSQRTFRFVFAAGLLAWLGIAVCTSLGQGQKPAAREYTIKAAYIYNFLRYIEWPSDAFEDSKSPFVIGLLGDVPPELDRSFAFYERSKKVRGRPIKIRHFKRAEEIADCHVVFLTRTLDKEVLQETIEQVDEDPTLLVGETNTFLQQGGAITFFLASNKVRIRLALKETRRKGLKPSAKLLQVAQVTD